MFAINISTLFCVLVILIQGIYAATYINMHFNFRLAIVVENGIINDTLISNVVVRRVNFNHRVLVSQTVSYDLIRASNCSSVNAVKEVCNYTGYSGIITVGNSHLVDEMNRLSVSMQIPHIGVPTNLCEETPASNFGVIGIHSAKDLFSAVAAGYKSTQAKSVAIYFDGNQAKTAIEDLQQKLSQAAISSYTYQVDNGGFVNVGSLSSHLTRFVKKQTKNMVIIASPANVDLILQAANASLVLQQNYFWMVLDTGITRHRIMSHLPKNANVVIVRGGTFGLTDYEQCSPSVLDVFPECNIDWISEIDVRFVDAVEAMAKAFNDTLNIDTTLPFAASNASCNTQIWHSGSRVYGNLMGLSNYNTHRGVLSYNSVTKHLNSGGVEFIGTYNARRSSNTQMFLSGTFNPTINQLTAKFLIDNQRFIFPNTFTGFKNETLVICSPEEGNLLIMLEEMLVVFSKQLNFQYVVKSARDKQWGGPVSGSPWYSGCVGEVQRGAMDIGGGRFTKVVIRDKVIDYSFPLIEEGTAIMLPTPPKPTKMWNVFTPLSYDVWILVIVLLVFTAFITWLLAYFSPFSGWNLDLEFAIADEVWFQEYMWSIFGSFLQQGQDFYPFAMSPRTMLAFWWFFTVILFGTYTGDLTAHLTISQSSTLIRSLDEFVLQDDILPAVVEGSNIHVLFAEATAASYIKVKEKMLPTTTALCSELVLTKKIACIRNYTPLLVFAEKNCGQVYFAEEMFNTQTSGFIWPEDAYFAEVFDYYFMKMDESGAMGRIINKYNKRSSECSSSKGNSAEADPIPLEGVGGAFILTGVLYILGILILIIEIVWTRILKKTPLQCFFY